MYPKIGLRNPILITVFLACDLFLRGVSEGISKSVDLAENIDD